VICLEEESRSVSGHTPVLCCDRLHISRLPHVVQVASSMAGNSSPGAKHAFSSDRRLEGKTSQWTGWTHTGRTSSNNPTPSPVRRKEDSVRSRDNMFSVWGGGRTNSGLLAREHRGQEATRRGDARLARDEDTLRTNQGPDRGASTSKAGKDSRSLRGSLRGGHSRSRPIDDGGSASAVGAPRRGGGGTSLGTSRGGERSRGDGANSRGDDLSGLGCSGNNGRGSRAGPNRRIGLGVQDPPPNGGPPPPCRTRNELLAVRKELSRLSSLKAYRAATSTVTSPVVSPLMVVCAPSPAGDRTPRYHRMSAFQQDSSVRTPHSVHHATAHAFAPPVPVARSWALPARVRAKANQPAA
jgi:hypothetical protein